jgi:hypothetical protein
MLRLVFTFPSGGGIYVSVVLKSQNKSSKKSGDFPVVIEKGLGLITSTIH